MKRVRDSGSDVMNAIGLNASERRCVREAASDAHMSVREYVRTMTLAAAGMGGIVEHLERAIDASSKAVP